MSNLIENRPARSMLGRCFEIDIDAAHNTTILDAGYVQKISDVAFMNVGLVMG